MWSDTLTDAEVEGTRNAAHSLAGLNWAAPLLTPLQEDSWWTSSNKPHMFEVRFAAELHVIGCQVQYEHDAGVGGKTIDFRVQDGQQVVLVELVSVEESDAVKDATKTSSGLEGAVTVSGVRLSTDQGKASEEGEYLLIQQKIAEKVAKFPSSTDGTLHIILVDVRGFGGGGNLDNSDLHHIAYGPSGLRDVEVMFWNDKPIVGLFEERNPLMKAKLLRERIHFIGFTNESSYKAGELRDPRAVFYLANPFLVPNETFKVIGESIPFRPIAQPEDTTTSSWLSLNELVCRERYYPCVDINKIVTEKDITHHEPGSPLTLEQCYEIGRQTALTGERWQVPSPFDLRFQTQEQMSAHVSGFQSVPWFETPAGKKILAERQKL